MRNPWLRMALLIGAVLAAGAVARWTPLRQWLDPVRLTEAAEPWRGNWLSPIVAIVTFSVAPLALIPVTLLVAVSGIVFGPWLGAAYALVGVLVGAMVGYGLGRAAGPHGLESVPAVRNTAIRLARGGILAVAALRLVPIAPFAVVNVAAGAFGIPFRDYIAGTGIGMAPGLVLLSLFGDRFVHVLRDPDPGSIAVALGLAVGVLACAWLAQRLVAPAGSAP